LGVGTRRTQAATALQVGPQLRKPICWLSVVEVRRAAVLPARRVIQSIHRYPGEAPLPSYNAVRTWAEVVEKVYKADAHERTQLLKEASHGGDPLIEPWAMRMLGQHRPGESEPFLNGVAANGKLTIPGQVTVDSVLAEIAPGRWLKSRGRLLLMENWVSGKIGDEADAMQVKARFQEALRRKELDVYTWLPLLTKWKANQSWSGDFTWMLQDVGPLHELPGQERQRQQQYVFDFAVQQIQQGTNHDMKHFGARWLFAIQLNEAQVAKVHSLISQTSDQALADILKATLSRPAGR
jgi:hypothetical protein